MTDSDKRYAKDLARNRKSSPEDLARMRALAANRDDWMYANAANYAEKIALRRALASCNPNHILLKDKSFQETIQGIGKRVATYGGDIKAIHDAIAIIPFP